MSNISVADFEKGVNPDVAPVDPYCCSDGFCAVLHQSVDVRFASRQIQNLIASFLRYLSSGAPGAAVQACFLTRELRDMQAVRFALSLASMSQR